MTTLRRSIPLLERHYRLFGSRCLHVISHLEAARSRPSPRIAKATVPPSGAVRVPKQSNSEDYLPPVALVSSASKSGAMDLEPTIAMEFLEAYVQNLKTSKTGWELDLCTKHGVTPTHMVILSGILRRCPTQPQKTLSKRLALSASEMGEKTATFELIQSALNQGRLHEYQSTFRRLKSLAKREGDIEAMALLGKVLFTQKDDTEALQWLQQATSPPTGHLDFAGSGEALSHIGQIHLKRGDRVAAEAAFKKAALDLDEPPAYFNLAQLQEHGSEAQRVYLLKAASSGVLEACHNLGVLELKKIEEAGKKPTSLEDYGMAREWIQVAATDGFGLSMLNMAMMCKEVGQEENALAWLKKAAAKDNVAAHARGLALKWAREAKRSA